MKRSIFLFCIFLLINASCHKDDEIAEEHLKDHTALFVGSYVGLDYLEIEKIDNSSVKLNFIHNGGWTVWNHSFYATVSGKSLTIPEWQRWESERLNCKGDGFIVDNILTINLYYSNGDKELGITFEKVKK